MDNLIIKHNPTMRDNIKALEAKMREHPDVLIGDSSLCPLKHSFAPGVYVREIFIPKGTLIVGKIHRHAHPNFILSGKVTVLTEEGPKYLEGPLSVISPAGTKRVVYAHEDTVWITVHVTEHTDLVKIEEEVIAKDYNELPFESEHKIMEFVNNVAQGESV